MRSKAIMSRISAVVATRMAYKEMNTALYVTITLLLYAFIVSVAMFLPSDIGSVLDLVSAYSISCIAFFIPAAFYKRSLQKFKMADPQEPKQKSLWRLANLFFCFGAFNGTVSLMSAILAIIGE